MPPIYVKPNWQKLRLEVSNYSNAEAFREELISRYRNRLVRRFLMESLRKVNGRDMWLAVSGSSWNIFNLYYVDGAVINTDGVFDRDTERWLEDHDIGTLFGHSGLSMLISFEQSKRGTLARPVDIIVSGTEGELKDKAKMYGGLENYVFNACKDASDSLVALLSIYNMQISMRSDLEQLRSNMLKVRYNWLDRLILLIFDESVNNIHRLSMRLRRLLDEIEIEDGVLMYERGNADRFTRVWKQNPYDRVDRLGEVLIRGIRFQGRALQRYTDALKKWQADILQTQNLRATLWLQIITIVVSVGALCISLWQLS
jgi:hypothetical protein